MARARGPILVCHVHDSWVSFEDHHIFPVGYGGPKKDPTNIIRICCNTHSDIHYLMERMFRDKPLDLETYGPKIRAWAKQGYDAVMKHAEEMATAAEAAAA